MSLLCDGYVELTCLVDLYSGAICHFVQQPDEAGLKLCKTGKHVIQLKCVILTFYLRCDLRVKFDPFAENNYINNPLTLWSV